MFATASLQRMEHALQVLSSLENMRSRDLICDLKVKVENRTFNTHRALLAACSGYFEALFSSNMKEAQDGYVAMKDVEASPIEQCIRYMYTGSCEIDIVSVEGILHGSNLLQIPSLEKRCFDFLKEHLELGNCFSILYLARAFNSQDVEYAAERFIVKNLETLISCDLFLKVSKKDLLRYICHANCETSWRAIKAWTKDREKEFEELAEQIDFTKYSFKILLNKVLNDPLVDKSQKIKFIVHKSLFSDSAELECNLDFGNCFRLKKFATDVESKEIINSFMCRSFPVVIHDPKFCDLSKGEVMHLLKSPEIDSEESKWVASLRWVKRDPECRKSSFPDLFSALKLMELPLKFLEETVRNEELVKTSVLCMNLLMDAFMRNAKQHMKRSTNSVEELNTVITFGANTSMICYKQQPPGQIGKWCNPFTRHSRLSTLSFEFKSGSCEGIQYQDCRFDYWIPRRDLLERVKEAFNARQLFRLKHKSGSNWGEIVLSDIPLDPEWGPSSLGCEAYAKKLLRKLEQKGF